MRPHTGIMSAGNAVTEAGLDAKNHLWLRSFCALWLAMAAIGASILLLMLAVQHGGGDEAAMGIFAVLILLFIAGIAMCWRYTKIHWISALAWLASIAALPIMFGTGLYNY